MTGSLNLPSGSALPGSAHSDQKASYQRRKNYDPIKAVEMEKQNKLMRKQSTPLQTSNSRNSIYSTENESHRSNIDYDSMSDSSSFSIPLQSLKASMSNKQVGFNLIHFFYYYSRPMVNNFHDVEANKVNYF